MVIALVEAVSLVDSIVEEPIIIINKRLYDLYRLCSIILHGLIIRLLLSQLKIIMNLIRTHRSAYDIILCFALL
ncbi:GSCOCG00003819001-RA-CDS [Cotesia congregata]|nr:GSCOCG00003819001-RA-CDS [Cotesia congregata]